MIQEKKDASIGYGKKTVLMNISFQVGSGEFSLPARPKDGTTTCSNPFGLPCG
jgi:hypothetical protein